MSYDTQVSHETHELINHAVATGASPAFVRTLLVRTDGRHHVRGVTRRAMENDIAPDARAGGFIQALWEGNVSKAWQRADGGNRKIMSEAGLVSSGIETLS
jgi:hypothetical protein